MKFAAYENDAVTDRDSNLQHPDERQENEKSFILSNFKFFIDISR